MGTLQALSIWPSIKRKQRSSKFDFFNPCLKWDISRKLFCIYSVPEIYLLSKPKRACFGVTFALAWASKEQAIGNNVMKEKLDSAGDFSDDKDFDNEDFDRIRLEGIKERDEDDSGGSGDDVDDEQQKGEIQLKEKARSEDNQCDAEDGEKHMMIDVRALAYRLHSVRTAEDVDEVLRNKGELSLQVYSSLVRGFGKDKRLESAMALVEWIKRKSKETNSSVRLTVLIYNSLLAVIKETENYNFVEQVLNDMAVEGIHPSVVTYNILMGIYIKQGREVEALNLFQEIPQKGLSASPASYSIALMAYQELGDGFGALKFYVEVKDKYLKGDIGNSVDENEDWEWEISKLENFCKRICIQVMWHWLVRSANSTTNLLRLLKEMDLAGVHPGREQQERLIWACTREEHCGVAKELYSRIRERNSEISISVCNHVIWLLGRAKKWWAAMEIYEDLVDKVPKPNNVSHELIFHHFHILLSAAQKRGIWKWGLKLLDKMEEKGLKPGTREWTSVLIACSKASETSAAVDVFKRMAQQGEKPTVISYGALLSALEKGKLYDEAVQVWKHMTKLGIMPNVHLYTIMASIYAAQGKSNIVGSIIEEMASVGIEPTVVTFNAIISSCARNGFGNEAYQWFQCMKLRNVLADEVTYEILIETLAGEGKPRVAYELYLRSWNEGLVLSSKAYDALVRSVELHRATIDLSALALVHQRNIKTFK